MHSIESIEAMDSVVSWSLILNLSNLSILSMISIISKVAHRELTENERLSDLQNDVVPVLKNRNHSDSVRFVVISE